MRAESSEGASEHGFANEAVAVMSAFSDEAFGHAVKLLFGAVVDARYA